MTFSGDPSEFPIGVVPPRIQAAIMNVWLKTQAPLPLVATSAFSALSIACQHLFDAGRPNGMTSPCSLFFLTIADSGERKTSTDRYFTQPIRDFERRHAEENRARHQEHTTQMDIWRAKDQGLKRKIQRLASKDEPTADAEQQLRQNHEEMPVAPASMRLLFDDVSTTAIITSLHNNWPSVGILSDEAGKLFNSKTFENIGLFNKLWDGDPVALDRYRTSGSYTVAGARLTMSLMSQQKTLQDFLEKQGNLARDNGFLARCLTCQPRSTQGNRHIDINVTGLSDVQSAESLTEFHDVLERLLQAAWKRHKESGVRFTVPMSVNAAQWWNHYYNSIESRLGVLGDWADIKDGAAKAAENIARLACLFAAFDSGESPDKAVIEVDHVHSAEMICRWYMGHFKALFGEESTLSLDHRNAEEIFVWLDRYWLHHQISIIDKNDILQFGPYKFRSKGALNRALDLLVRQQKVRVGRPTPHSGKRAPVQVWRARSDPTLPIPNMAAHLV